MLAYQITYALTPDHPAKMIRQAVFVQEQGFQNEFDDIDEHCLHFTFYLEKTPIGCARLFDSIDRPGWLTIGRVAILKPYRQHHYGREMMNQIEQFALHQKAHGLELSSQLSRSGFYQRCGFHKIGHIYMDEHCPHIHMEKILLPLEK